MKKSLRIMLKVGAYCAIAIPVWLAGAYGVNALSNKVNKFIDAKIKD